MRKKDVFGKKINMSKPLFNLILVFVIAIIGFLSINYYQKYQISLLETEQSQIEATILSQILLNKESSYQEIESLLPYLPQSYNEVIIYNEMLLAINLSELSNDDYSIAFQSETDIPFTESLSDDLACVEMNISLSFDDIEDFFSYLNYLEAMDRIYYVNDAFISFGSNSSVSVSISVYTFYMNN